MLFAKKCPMCSTKMSKVNGVLTCPICGYSKSPRNTSYITSDSGAITRNTKASNVKPYRQYPKQPRTNNNAPGIFVVLLILFAGIFIPAIAWFFAHERNSASSSYGEDSYSDALSDYYDLRLHGYDPSKKVPQTPFFSQTVCRIFNKEIDDVSTEDIARVISLHVYRINYDYLAVDYALTDGTSGTVYPVSQFPDVSNDLTCFVNLEELDLEVSYPTLNLSGLDKLHTLYVPKRDFDKIAETITPSQITSLGIYNGSSFLGLRDFSNVESLYLDNWMNNDINEIADLPKLKKLTIVDGFSIDDLSVLYNLTQLESLSIDSELLTDVTFLTKFNHLTALYKFFHFKQ